MENTVKFEITSPMSTIEQTIERDGEVVRVAHRMGAVIDLTARRAQQLAADGVGRIVEDQPAPQPATEAAKAKDTAGTPATTDASNKNAPFEVVVAICKEILEKGEELTKQRKPDLEAVRLRVKDAGYDSEAITAAIRDKATEAAKA